MDQMAKQLSTGMRSNNCTAKQWKVYAKFPKKRKVQK